MRYIITINDSVVNYDARYDYFYLLPSDQPWPEKFWPNEVAAFLKSFPITKADKISIRLA